ncbi:MAG TPA: YdeI/OmpD-associated family protein [Anaerolineae bacterium]
MKLVFFPAPADFRNWLEQHHTKAQELWVGFYKKDSGKPSITWPESVDEALCFGWIDGIRKSIDDVSYTIRFTPRKPDSTWSSVNVRQVVELTKMGRMTPAGLKVFEERDLKKSGLYSYERANAKLDAAYETKLRANKKAWAFFQAQPPSYRRLASWWVISAKKEETRLKRLDRLIQDSAHARTIPPLTRPTRSRKGPSS